jgi:hypothetical protein
MSRPIQFFVYVFAGLLSAIIILFVIDYYLVSWTVFLLETANICSHKSFSTNSKLSSSVDTQYIKNEIRKNQNYRINDKYQSGSGVNIQRDFGDVIYNIRFENKEKFEFDTSVSIEKYRISYLHGEACSTPNYFIRKYFVTMIDDLPITDAQKKEMKNSFWVYPVIKGNLLF